MYRSSYYRFVPLAFCLLLLFLAFPATSGSLERCSSVSVALNGIGAVKIASISDSCMEDDISLRLDTVDSNFVPVAMPHSKSHSAKLWVIPHWANCLEKPLGDEGDGETYLACTGSSITFINPGDATANTSCYFFNSYGALLVGAIQSTSLGKGDRAVCYSPTIESAGGAREGWAILSSSQDIVPNVETAGESAALPNHESQAHPVDCNGDNRHEVVCTFAMH